MPAEVMDREEYGIVEPNPEYENAGRLFGDIDRRILQLVRTASEFRGRLDALEKLHYKGIAPTDNEDQHNWPEPEKPHTCAECKYPYWRRHVGICLNNGCTAPVSKGREACPKFEEAE